MPVLWIDAAPALIFFVLPFAASTLAALVCAAVHVSIQRGPRQDTSAGDWLAARVERLPGLRLGVAPEIAGSADGYWPDSAFVGLSPRTWVERTHAGRAIAAHELGHALAWRFDRAAAAWRARLRRVQTGALALTGAGVLTATLFDSAFAANVAWWALAVGLLGHVASLLDEADASRRGARVLALDGLRTRGTDLAMLSAFGVYLAPALVHLALWLTWPWLTALMLSPVQAARVNSEIGLWSIIALAPLLLLRAMQVIADVVRSTPITSEFRLDWTVFQERTWEFHSGTVVLVWLALTYDQPVTRDLAPWFLLGLLPAMGPLGGLGRLVIVLPIALVFGLLGVRGDPPRLPADAPRPVDPLTLIADDTRWWARAPALARVAWIPLLAVLLPRALSGW